MKYIKDFFYNLSDLFIILLILAIAGGLIYWRVNIIMDYPEALAAEFRDGGNQSLVPDDILNSGGSDNSDSNGGTDAGGDSDNSSEGGTEENTGEGNENSGNAEGGENSGEGNENSGNAEGGENSEEGGTTPGAPIDSSTEHEPGAGPRDNTIWKDGKLRVDMTVDLESGSSEDAVESLVQAGLFSSYDDFAAICEKIDVDPGLVRAGSYTFSAGSTQEDIAEAVTID